MFGWFGPTCPCDPAAKRWVEDRLEWLSQQFGLHILLERPLILPTAEFFPDPWDSSPKAVRRMFRRVCRYMQVDPDAIELKLFTDKTPGGIVAIDPTRLTSDNEKKNKRTKGEHKGSPEFWAS